MVDRQPRAGDEPDQGVDVVGRRRDGTPAAAAAAATAAKKVASPRRTASSATASRQRAVAESGPSSGRGRRPPSPRTVTVIEPAAVGPVAAEEAQVAQRRHGRVAQATLRRTRPSGGSRVDGVGPVPLGDRSARGGEAERRPGQQAADGDPLGLPVLRRHAGRCRRGAAGAEGPVVAGERRRGDELGRARRPRRPGPAAGPAAPCRSDTAGRAARPVRSAQRRGGRGRPPGRSARGRCRAGRGRGRRTPGGAARRRPRWRVQRCVRTASRMRSKGTNRPGSAGAVEHGEGRGGPLGAGVVLGVGQRGGSTSVGCAQEARPRRSGANGFIAVAPQWASRRGADTAPRGPG